MAEKDYDLCRCGHNRMLHDKADDSVGCFADLPRNDRGELEMCPCAAFEFDAWAEITAWARAGIEDRSMMSDEEIADLTTRAEEQIRADERARLADQIKKITARFTETGAPVVWTTAQLARLVAAELDKIP